MAGQSTSSEPTRSCQLFLSDFLNPDTTINVCCLSIYLREKVSQINAVKENYSFFWGGESSGNNSAKMVT